MMKFDVIFPEQIAGDSFSHQSPQTLSPQRVRECKAPRPASLTKRIYLEMKKWILERFRKNFIEKSGI